MTGRLRAGLTSLSSIMSLPIVGNSATGVGVGVGVACGVGTDVGAGVGVACGVDVAPGSGVDVGTGVGVGDGSPPSLPPHDANKTANNKHISPFKVRIVSTFDSFLSSMPILYVCAFYT